MKAARLHRPGDPFCVDEIPMPEPGPGDVLVKVRACGVVPNLRAVVSGKYWHTLPPLPAVYGLDATGEVVAFGDGVRGLRKGLRVYVNPILYCGACAYCRSDTPLLCTGLALRGYFGYARDAEPQMRRYPYGGFSQYLTARADSLVELPADVGFERGARFGYLCTAFAALERAGMRPGMSVMVNGGTGTLGVGAVLVALAMGASRILATGRNRTLLARVAAIRPGTIATFEMGGGSLGEWMKAETEGLGPEILLDCLGRGADAGGIKAAMPNLRRGGRVVNIGALAEGLQLDPTAVMVNQIAYMGSNWFTTGQARRMAALAASGQLDLSHFEDRIFELERVNEALDFAAGRPGGFANVVVVPNSD